MRATVKGHRTAGTDITAPFIYGGTDAKGAVTDKSDHYGRCGMRFEGIEVRRDGVYAIGADGKAAAWIGGVATKFWMLPVPAETVTDELDSLTFPELMVIAKQIKLAGRGTARKPQLIAGIRAHRAA